jgi:hypothetical protein
MATTAQKSARRNTPALEIQMEETGVTRNPLQTGSAQKEFEAGLDASCVSSTNSFARNRKLRARSIPRGLSESCSARATGVQSANYGCSDTAAARRPIRRIRTPVRPRCASAWHGFRKMNADFGRRPTATIRVKGGIPEIVPCFRAIHGAILLRLRIFPDFRRRHPRPFMTRIRRPHLTTSLDSPPARRQNELSSIAAERRDFALRCTSGGTGGRRRGILQMTDASGRWDVLTRLDVVVFGISLPYTR